MVNVSCFLVILLTMLTSFAMVILLMYSHSITQKGAQRLSERKTRQGVALLSTGIILPIIGCIASGMFVWHLPDIFPL